MTHLNRNSDEGDRAATAMSMSVMSFTGDENSQENLQSKVTGISCSKNRCCRLLNSSYHTKFGKQLQMFKLLVVSTVSVIVLVIQNGLNVKHNLDELHVRLHLQDDTRFSMQTGEVLDNIQEERGISAMLVSSLGDFVVYDFLRDKYKNTDRAIGKFTEWPDMSAFAAPNYLNSRAQFQEHIRAYRKQMDPTNDTIDEVLDAYERYTSVFISWIVESSRNDSTDLWRMLVGYHVLMLSKDHAGEERALGATYYTRGQFPQEDQLRYLEKRVKSETYLERSAEYTPNVHDYLLSNFKGTNLERILTRMREELAQNNKISPSLQMASWWFDNMTLYLDILKVMQDRIATDVLNGLDVQIGRLQNDLIVSVLIMVIIIVFLLPAVIFWVHRLTKRMQSFASSLHQKTRDLVHERKRTKMLLYELLPPSIARQMLTDKPVAPEAFDSVTVFFSDVVGFTEISSRCSPLQVVAMLNALYQAFDSKLEKYDAYKVETIGDAYMVASGLPNRNGICHSREISLMALDILETIRHVEIPHQPDETFRLRIGINTGPVVAGVVGYKMPRYCLFGDTVNTASRMESTGLPLRIQITEATERHLRLHEEFVVDERGDVEIKGKGAMRTYWLVGHKSIEITTDTIIMVT